MDDSAQTVARASHQAACHAPTTTGYGCTMISYSVEGRGQRPVTPMDPQSPSQKRPSDPALLDRMIPYHEAPRPLYYVRMYVRTYRSSRRTGPFNISQTKQQPREAAGADARAPVRPPFPPCSSHTCPPPTPFDAALSAPFFGATPGPGATSLTPRNLLRREIESGEFGLVTQHDMVFLPLSLSLSRGRSRLVMGGETSQSYRMFA